MVISRDIKFYIFFILIIKHYGLDWVPGGGLTRNIKTLHKKQKKHRFE
jgi:hypothetical protein